MRGFDWSKRPDITARILEVYRGRLLQETTQFGKPRSGLLLSRNASRHK